MGEPAAMPAHRDPAWRVLRDRMIVTWTPEWWFERQFRNRPYRRVVTRVRGGGRADEAGDALFERACAAIERMPRMPRAAWDLLYGQRRAAFDESSRFDPADWPWEAARFPTLGHHAKWSSSNSRSCCMLYLLVRVFEARRAMELGTAYGLGAAAMLAGVDRREPGCLHTIEMIGPIHAFAARSLRQRFGDVAVCHRGRFEDLFPDVAKCGPFDFVFLDSLHDPDTMLADLGAIADACAPGGAILIDDVGWWNDREKRRRWDEFVASPRVSRAASIGDRFVLGRRIPGRYGLALLARP